MVSLLLLLGCNLELYCWLVRCFAWACVSLLAHITKARIIGARALETLWRHLKDVRANCFCASLLRTTARANSHATSCIERARQVLKWTMIGQMAIAIALLGFNALGRWVTPTFLFRNRLYLQLSPHCSEMNKKSMWEVKKISRFLSTGQIELRNRAYDFRPNCTLRSLWSHSWYFQNVRVYLEFGTETF